MTNREFFKAVIADTENEVITTFARNAIEKLNAKNAQRSSKMTKTQIENKNLKVDMITLLCEQPYVASEMGEALEISTSKASALLRQLVDSGKATFVEVRVPKKGKVCQYSIAE